MAGALLRSLPAPPLSPLLAPIDSARAHLLKAIAPRARSLVVDRERRVAVATCALVVTAFLAACSIPIWVIALGPIVWGVPHVLADFRYLVARPGIHRRALPAIAIAAGVLSGAFGLGVRGALLGAMAAIVVSRGPLYKRAIGVVVFGALFALAQASGLFADLLFGQLHNAVGVGLWLAWRRRVTGLHALPVALIVVFASIVLLGAAAPVVLATHGLESPFSGLPTWYLANTLGFGSSIAPRLIVLYAFGQSVHYAMWLRAIPEEDRPTKAPRSYAQSYRALVADLGAPIVWIAFLSAIALVVWAIINVGGARNGYLRFAFFHGYLEIAAAAFLWSEGTLRGERPSAALVTARE